MGTYIKTPLLSVVMSVYNGERYLEEAISSILKQSFRDFEFIIINDGSTDSTVSILNKYRDPRIKIITQKNMGLVASLNTGIKLAKGKYIARQDADDRSEPERLTRQVEFLKNNPGVVAVGSSMNVMDSTSKIKHRHSVLLHDAEIREEILVRSPFAHGSVIFLRDVAIKSGLYRQSYWPAEDYDLWLRISESGQLANVDEFLYTYREHDEGISAKNNSSQVHRSEIIRSDAWQKRNSLISKKFIHLRDYRGSTHSEMRTSRIILNVSSVSKKATRNGNLLFASRVWLMLLKDPSNFRVIAGKIKSRILH